MKQMIIEIDTGTEFDDLPEDQQADIQSANIVWPESIMLGTEAVDGKTLLMIATTASVEQIEGMIAAHELEWAVLASEGVTVDQDLLLPYYSDLPIFDEDGEQTGFEPVTDLTGKIQTFAGKTWNY